MDDSRFHAEESLEKCLADAYESMSPDEEARRRMLAELLAASERRAPNPPAARRDLAAPPGPHERHAPPSPGVLPYRRTGEYQQRP